MFKQIKKNNKIAKYLIALGISIGVIYYIISITPRNYIPHLIEVFSPLYFSISFFFFFLNLLFRSFVFHKLLRGERVRLWNFFHITSLYNFFTTFIPAGMGEFSYIFLCNRVGVKPEKGLGSLILNRVYEGIVISILIICSILFLFWENANIRNLILPIVIVIGSGLFVVVWFLVAIIAYLQKQISKISHKKPIWEKIVARIEALQSFLQLRSNRNFFLSLFFLTIPKHITAGLALHFGVKSLGFTPYPWESIFVICLFTFLVLIPIKGIANLGTFEAYLAAGFILFGYQKEPLFITLLVYHFLVLLQTVFFAIWGYLGLYIYSTGKESKFKVMVYGAK